MSQQKKCLALIDDDPLVHQTWAIMSTHVNEKLYLSFTLDEFLSQNVPKDTPIYVDNYLGHENGALVAQKLLELGYQFVFLCTGLNPEHIPPIHGLSGIVGKEYPS